MMDIARNICFILCLFVAVSMESTAQSYKAAVVVFKPEDNKQLIPGERITKHVAKFKGIMDLVKNKADIIIFPEFGLTNNPQKVVDIYLDPYSFEIKTGTNLCSDKNATIHSLGCAAKENQLYLVFNVVENIDKEKHYYITDVVVDPNGEIVFKCRRNRLWTSSSSFSTDSNQKACTFEAKFKNNNLVNFSVLYDADILYPVPVEIDNVIMTSSIDNKLPFEYGLSLQTGFAASNKVNLLVAGYNEPPKNFGGSGIYLRNGTSIVALNGTNSAINFEGSSVLIEEIPSDKTKYSEVQVNSRSSGAMYRMQLPYANVSVLENMNKTVDICLEDEKFCCKFRAELENETIAPYRWVASYNQTVFLEQNVSLFTCALVRPSNVTKSLRFKNISVTSSFKDASQILPVSLNTDMLLPKYAYKVDGTDGSIILLKEDDIITFGIIRVIGDTPHHSPGSSKTVWIVVIVLVVILLIILILFFIIVKKRQRLNIFRRSEM